MGKIKYMITLFIDASSSDERNKFIFCKVVQKTHHNRLKVMRDFVKNRTKVSHTEVIARILPITEN